MAQTKWLKNRGVESEFDNKHNLTKSITNTIKAYQIDAQIANGSPIAPQKLRLMSRELSILPKPLKNTLLLFYKSLHPHTLHTHTHTHMHLS